jgi:L-amino acid N-acyltransferase YncA
MKKLRKNMCDIAKSNGMTVMRSHIHPTNTASIQEMLSVGGKEIGVIDDKDNVNCGFLMLEMSL